MRLVPLARHEQEVRLHDEVRVRVEHDVDRRDQHLAELALPDVLGQSDEQLADHALVRNGRGIGDSQDPERQLARQDRFRRFQVFSGRHAAPPCFPPI